MVCDSKAKASVAKWFGVSTQQSEVQNNILKWHRRSMVVHGHTPSPLIAYVSSLTLLAGLAPPAGSLVILSSVCTLHGVCHIAVIDFTQLGTTISRCDQRKAGVRCTVYK